MRNTSFVKKNRRLRAIARRLIHCAILREYLYSQSGDYGMKVTPVPIPNTKVKLQCADGTARVTLWESRSSPGNVAG